MVIPWWFIRTNCTVQTNYTMVVLTSLSHYNSIIELRARFLLSLMEGFSIDFPSHFIAFIIDVYRNITTHVSSSFLQLSRGSFNTSPFLFLSLLFSPSWVPLALVLSDRVRLSFNRSSHEYKRPILPMVVWPSRSSWSSFSGCMLTLVVIWTLSLMRCIRWTLEYDALLVDRLAWLVLLLLPLLLQRPF